MTKSGPEIATNEFGEEAFSFAAEFLKNWVTTESGWLSGATENWSVETRRQIEELSAHNLRALQEFQSAKTPLDVVKIEQEWIMARSKAGFEAGMRMAKLFADVAQTASKLPLAPGR